MTDPASSPAIPEWARSISSELHERMGITVTEISADRVVGTMPVEGNRQPMGLLHGGASAVLVEGLASLGALAHGHGRGLAGVGVDLNLTHLRAARSGLVTGVATPLHLGGRVAIYEVELTDDSGRRTAVGRLTCQLVPVAD